MKQSKKDIEANKYREKYSYWTFGKWNMHNISNRQAIIIGRLLDKKKLVESK